MPVGIIYARQPLYCRWDILRQELNPAVQIPCPMIAVKVETLRSKINEVRDIITEQ